MTKRDEELLLTPEQSKLARSKGYSDYEYILACLNAEVNGLADPELRDNKRVDKFVEMAKGYIAQLAKAKKHYEQKESVEFGQRIAKAMNDLRSSHVFFIIQQAYSDMEWEGAQSILNKVIEEIDD